MDSKQTPTSHSDLRSTDPTEVPVATPDTALEALARLDPADAPDTADSLADQLGAMLDGDASTGSSPNFGGDTSGRRAETDDVES